MASEPESARRLAGTLAKVGDAVMIRHTLFSLPFAVAAVLLETSGRPSGWKLFWIIVAATGARNSANALNRLIDREIDAKNPRTADRPLVRGTVSATQLKVFTAAMLGLLVLGAGMLNPLCLALLPLAGILVFGYSYTKRYTWLCHYWLGLTCSAATLGAFLGISGYLAPRFLPLTAGVALWVAGFDILYALQDIEFDRKEGLHSVPARFGASGARILAVLSHAGAVAGMASVLYFWPETGPGTIASLIVCIILLAAEHLIARQGTAKHIKIAAYGINEFIPALFLIGVALDMYLM